MFLFHLSRNICGVKRKVHIDCRVRTLLTYERFHPRKSSPRYRFKYSRTRINEGTLLIATHTCHNTLVGNAYNFAPGLLHINCCLKAPRYWAFLPRQKPRGKKTELFLEFKEFTLKSFHSCCPVGSRFRV